MTSQTSADEKGAPTAMASVSVSAPKLRRMLTAVIPHAGRDDSLPALGNVKFEVVAGVLYLVATDRYTIGVAREEIPGATESPIPDAAFLLPLKAARALRRMLKGAAEVAALTVANDRLTVDCGGGTSGGWAVESAGNFPGWRPMVHKMIAAPQCELGNGHGIDMRLLKRFAATRKGSSWPEPVNIRILGRESGKGGPILALTCGEWFAGCQTPVRMGRELHRTGEGAVLTAERAWEMWADVTAPVAVVEKAEATA